MADFPDVNWGLSDFEDPAKWAAELESVGNPSYKIAECSVRLRSLALELWRLSSSAADEEDEEEEEEEPDDDDDKDDDYVGPAQSDAPPPTTPSTALSLRSHGSPETDALALNEPYVRSFSWLFPSRLLICPILLQCFRCLDALVVCQRPVDRPNPSRCVRCDRHKKGCAFPRGTKNRAKAPVPVAASDATAPPIASTSTLPPTTPASVRSGKRKISDRSPETIVSRPPASSSGRRLRSSQSATLPSDTLPPSAPSQMRMPTPFQTPPPSAVPIRSHHSSAGLDLEYENELLREQLNASQEDLRSTQDQLSRERNRFARLSEIMKGRIARLTGKGKSKEDSSRDPL